MMECPACRCGSRANLPHYGPGGVHGVAAVADGRSGRATSETVLSAGERACARIAASLMQARHKLIIHKEISTNLYGGDGVIHPTNPLNGRVAS